MDQILKNRLKLRHALLTELCDKAAHICSRAETGVTLQEVTDTKVKLAAATNNFEKDYLKLIECTTDFNVQEQETYTQAQMKAEELISELEVVKLLSKEQEEPMKPTTSAKLPKLEIPKFNGDILKWPEFWDRFESNIHCRQMRNVDKLSYLFASMEGAALEALRGIDITNEGYDIALSILKRRFANNAKVVDAHYNALTNLPKATEYSNRSTLDMIQKHLRILQSLGEDTTGNFLRNLIYNKFPEKVLYELNLITPVERDITTIIDGLEKIVSAKEQSTTSCTLDTTHTSSTEALQVRSTAIASRKRKQERRPWTEMSKKFKRECAFCSGPHFSDRCQTLKTYAQRTKALGNKCFRCFKAGHIARRCRDNTLCQMCKGPHNRALCPTKWPRESKTRKFGKKKPDPVSTTVKPPAEGEKECSNEDTTGLYTNMESFLQTATVKIRNNNLTIPARLLLDSGSQRSYITKKLAEKLKLVPDREDRLVIYTFGSNNPQVTESPSVEVNILTKRNVEKSIRVNIIPHITDKVKVTQLKESEVIDLTADDDETGDGIDILLGNDYYFSFLRDRRVKIKENLYLVDTDFGWIVSGFVSEETVNDLSLITYCQCHDSNCPYLSEPDLPLRNVDMKFLWSLESIGITDSPKCTREEEAVKHFNETIRCNEEGRYEVKWPWIQYPPELPTNFGLAFGRLKSLLRRADAETLKDYEDIFKEQLEAGIIEEVQPERGAQCSRPVHYLPHHIVKQTGKRGRIVYDASAKIKDEKSLNECMYRGPSLLEDLTALLLKFRTGRVGISADVEKAFLQVGLREEDRDVTRFLWVKNINEDPSEDNLMHYRFCRVPFGVIASPFLLTATIRYHLTSNQTLLRKIADRTYVDNLVTSAESSSAACHLYEKTRKVFEDLSMNIRDWISNDKEFMERIPQEHRAKGTETVKILGLTWNTEDDTLKLKLPKYEPKTSVTKKEVLRTLARLYDPCGFVSAYMLPIKLMFQQTCVLKLKWDSSLPPDLQQEWPKVLDSIEAATKIEIPRYVGYNMQEDEVTRQLHCFTDASKNAYAAVVYLVLRGKNKTSTAFLMSKARITPVEDKEDLKIPRLELLGFLIGSRLLRYVGENLDLEIHQKFLWTDSMIVLSWMKTSKLLPPFVSRRVNEIRENKDFALRYVPTEVNPADIATRPDSIHDKKELWFSGPEFLTKDENEWPRQTPNEEKTLFSAEEGLVPEDPEMAGKGYEEIGEVEEIQVPVQDLEDSNPPVKEIKELQQKYFPDEVAGKQTSLARNLDLFLDIDGILRCGGRMMNADWSYDTKHPILIPKQCDFTNNVIQRTHEENYHVGTSHTLSLVRKKYWIPQGRAQVTRILKMCPQCIRHGGGPYQLPATPALPSERVNYSVPFTFTGMDYFGPIFVEASGRNEKRWVCLFTCLAVRAIHLELVNDLTAQECLLGMRRFVACRGKPSLVVSDNAAQFKLTSEIFMDPHCVENDIRWKFIPQLAPWHGGVYERLVGVVKNCLKRTLDKHLLQDGQLMTIVKEVESVVNSRPLTIVTSEAEHILRPADFLTLGNCLELIPSKDMSLEGTSVKIDLLKSWKRGQKILQEFKVMFRDRYLPSLRERYFQRPKQPKVTSERSPSVGDVVQIKDDSKNRLNWRVGKISALLRGQDGKYRVAKVKVGEREFTRSIGHLYPLEAQLEEEETYTGRKDSERRTPIESGASAPPDTVEVELPMELDVTQPEQALVQEESMQVDQTPATVEEPQIEVEEDSMELFDCRPKPVEEVLEFRGDSDPLKDATTSETPDRRSGRQAAARAREKIAEWTRHLLSIFQ